MRTGHRLTGNGKNPDLKAVEKKNTSLSDEKMKEIDQMAQLAGEGLRTLTKLHTMRNGCQDRKLKRYIDSAIKTFVH